MYIFLYMYIGMHHGYPTHRPYLYAASVFAVLGIPYTTFKAMNFHYPPRPRNWPFLTLMLVRVYASIHSFIVPAGDVQPCTPYVHVHHMCMYTIQPCTPYTSMYTINYTINHSTIQTIIHTNTIHTQTPHPQINIGMSTFHVLTANRVMTWARRRFHLGLVGFGYPWERGEEAAVLFSSYKAAGPFVDMSDADVAPEMLADDDSLFVRIGKLKVHYKCWHPPDRIQGVHSSVSGVHSRNDVHSSMSGVHSTASGVWHEEGLMEAGPSRPVFSDVFSSQHVYQGQHGETPFHVGGMDATRSSTSKTRMGIVLVHGFGGGAFAWRHVGPRLAAETGVVVVAFDRPGFGMMVYCREGGVKMGCCENGMLQRGRRCIACVCDVLCSLGYCMTHTLEYCMIHTVNTHGSQQG